MFCYLRVSISYVWINPFSPQISFFFNTNDNNWAIKMRISLISIFISYDDILLLNTKSIAKLQIIFILFLYINWIKVFKQFSNECSKISKKKTTNFLQSYILSKSGNRQNSLSGKVVSQLSARCAPFWGRNPKLTNKIMHIWVNQHDKLFQVLMITKY